MTNTDYDFSAFDFAELKEAEKFLTRKITLRLAEGENPDGPTIRPLVERRAGMRSALAAKENPRQVNGAQIKDPRAPRYWQGFRDGKEAAADQFREKMVEEFGLHTFFRDAANRKSEGDES